MENLYRNILLPVDGSLQSVNAFKNGVRIAKSIGSNVYLVQVIKENDETISIPDRENLLNALADYARREEGIIINKEVIFGDPRSQLATELVNKWDIDLIVMGATGKGRVAKMVIGSITNYVLRETKADVLISR